MSKITLVFVFWATALSAQVAVQAWRGVWAAPTPTMCLIALMATGVVVASLPEPGSTEDRRRRGREAGSAR